MPFYEYECTNCKFYVEALQKISDPPMRKCPSCKKQTLKRLVSAPVFRLKGGMPEGLKEMGPTFDYIYSTWLPASGYVIAAPMNLEKYTIDDKNNVIEILIPVKKKDK